LVKSCKVLIFNQQRIHIVTSLLLRTINNISSKTLLLYIELWLRRYLLILHHIHWNLLRMSINIVLCCQRRRFFVKNGWFVMKFMFEAIDLARITLITIFNLIFDLLISVFTIYLLDGCQTHSCSCCPTLVRTSSVLNSYFWMISFILLTAIPLCDSSHSWGHRSSII
jgi:hypothetical protein